MSEAGARGEDRERASRTGPRALSIESTRRYRFAWRLNRLVLRGLFDLRSEGLERWPAAPFLLVCNHHNGFDPLLVLAATPREPRITWFGPKETDFSHGFKNRVMAFTGGVIPYHPDRTTLISAVRAVRRVFAAGGVVGIFAEGRIGFHEAELLPLEEGAVGFAVAAQVPILPAALIGTTELWFRRRIVIRCGAAIETAGAHRGAARTALEAELRAALLALLPATEPPPSRRRPLHWLTDLLNGADDIARRSVQARSSEQLGDES